MYRKKDWGDEIVTVMEKLSDGTMYLLCGGIIAFVALVCVVFAVRAWKEGKAIGMDTGLMKKVVKASAAFSVLPAVAIHFLTYFPPKLIPTGLAPHDLSLPLDAAIAELKAKGEAFELFTCGPDGLLKAVTERAVAHGVPGWISCDRHMICGVGACYACIQRTVRGNSRCCVEGPVFRAEDLVWE